MNTGSYLSYIIRWSKVAVDKVLWFSGSVFLPSVIPPSACCFLCFAGSGWGESSSDEQLLGPAALIIRPPSTCRSLTNILITAAAAVPFLLCLLNTHPCLHTSPGNTPDYWCSLLHFVVIWVAFVDTVNSRFAPILSPLPVFVAAYKPGCNITREWRVVKIFNCIGEISQSWWCLLRGFWLKPDRKSMICTTKISTAKFVIFTFFWYRPKHFTALASFNYSTVKSFL